MSPELRRLRAAFPTREAAERFVARIQASPDHDLERLAKRIVDHASIVSDSARALSSVAKVLSRDDLPLMSEDAIAGMAGLAAAQVQVEAEAAEVRAQGLRDGAAPGPLSEKSVWQNYVNNDRNSAEGFGALLSAIRKSDIDWLINKCNEGSGKGPNRALRISGVLLARLVETDDPRFPLEARVRWIEVIKPRLLDLEQVYFHDDYLFKAWAAIDAPAVEATLLAHASVHGLLGRHSTYAQRLILALSGGGRDDGADRRRSKIFERIIRHQISKQMPVTPLLDLWIRSDRPGAARFLIKEWRIDDRDDRLLTTLVDGLATLATKPARKRLMELRALGGRGGNRAEAVLELLGEIPPTGLDAIAAAWKQAPTRALIKQFYLRYIDGMPPVPIAKWTDFMYARQPNENAYAITTKDGGYLFLEVDHKGNLRGYKFED
jgi:hypothetical protein